MTPEHPIPGHPVPRFFAVGNARGGGGKSTVVLSLASDAAKRLDGLRVAVVDGDSQASASEYVGVRAVTQPLRAEPIEVHGFTLYPGGQGLHTASIRELSAHLARAARDADVVLVDLPPALAHPMHAAALRHPDARLLIVPPLEPGAMQSAQRLAALARRQSVPFHVLGNRLDRRRAITAAIATWFDEAFAGHVLGFHLPDAAVALQAVLARTPVPLFRPNAPLSLSLKRAGELLLHLPPEVP